MDAPLTAIQTIGPTGDAQVVCPSIKTENSQSERTHLLEQLAGV